MDSVAGAVAAGRTQKPLPAIEGHAGVINRHDTAVVPANFIADEKVLHVTVSLVSGQGLVFGVPRRDIGHVAQAGFFGA